MGLHFGELYKGIRGVVYYRLSPYEQKPFANAFSKGIPNIFKTRMFPDFFYWAPCFLSGAILYFSLLEMHHRNGLKDPKEFADEVDPEPQEVEEKKCIPKDE